MTWTQDLELGLAAAVEKTVTAQRTGTHGRTNRKRSKGIVEPKGS